MTALNIVLVVALVASALATVMTARVLRSAIALALTSVIVAILMYQLNSPLAAVFELSVCAGLIPAIFISTISLTKRLGPDDMAQRRKLKMRMFGALPLLIAVTALVLWHMPLPIQIAPPTPGAEQDVRNVMWNLRYVDMLGQIAILGAGAFGVVILVKGGKRD